MKSYGRLQQFMGQHVEREYSLAKDIVSIGRSTINDIPISDPRVSRHHARLHQAAGGIEIEDLGSTNGTRVNGQIVQRISLAPGDVIEIGGTTLRFGDPSPRADVEGTIIDAPPLDTETDLDATLAASALEVALSDVSVPRLIIHSPAGTREVRLTQEMDLGRDAHNDIILDHPKASRRHAHLRQEGGQWIIKDLDSTNGTWYGGERIRERHLVTGDTLRIGDAQLVFKGPVEEQELTLIDEPIAGRARRRPVVIVPGLMGSELWRGDQRIWPDVRRMFLEPEALRLTDSPDLEPRSLVHQVVVVPNLVKQDQYNRLVDFLVEELSYQPGQNLLEFPYDWRQDLRVSAGKLSEAVGRWREEQGHGRVTIIGHSLGCMVSRYFADALDGQEHVERLILMGGPLRGVPKMLLGLLMGKGLLPFGLLGDRLRTVIATFPSCYQVLPTYPCVFTDDGTPIDLGSDASWVLEGYQDVWRLIRPFWQGLQSTSSVPVLSVFGYGMPTVTRLSVERDRSGRWRDIRFEQEERGDAAVPEESAVLPGCAIHPVQQAHGALFTDSDVKMRLKLELVGWKA